MQPVGSITLKDGSSRDKRSLVIGDDSKRMIGITLWGDVCHKEIREMQIVAFRACRISEYRGKSLNASSDMNDTVVEAEHPRVRELRRWLGDRNAAELKDEMTNLGGEVGPSGSSKKD